MKRPALRADFEGGYGHVAFPPEWRLNDAMLRADLLKDWIEQLEEEYQIACFELLPIKFMHRC